MPNKRLRVPGVGPSDEYLARLRAPFGGGAAKKDTGYGSWKVAALKTELESRGLSTSGKKADLVARLEESD